MLTQNRYQQVSLTNWSTANSILGLDLHSKKVNGALNATNLHTLIFNQKWNEDCLINVKWLKWYHGDQSAYLHHKKDVPILILEEKSDQLVRWIFKYRLWKSYYFKMASEKGSKNLEASIFKQASTCSLELKIYFVANAVNLGMWCQCDEDNIWSYLMFFYCTLYPRLFLP